LTGGWAASARIVSPGAPGIAWAGPGVTRRGTVPTLPAWSITRTWKRYVPGGAGAPSTVPSQRQRCRPLGISPLATRSGSGVSVRQTSTWVGVRRLTRATRTTMSWVPGPTIRPGRTSRTYGCGGFVSIRSLAGTITERPVSRMLTRTW
jgi:hypothetical protein